MEWREGADVFGGMVALGQLSGRCVRIPFCCYLCTRRLSGIRGLGLLPYPTR